MKLNAGYVLAYYGSLENAKYVKLASAANVFQNGLAQAVIVVL